MSRHACAAVATMLAVISGCTEPVEGVDAEETETAVDALKQCPLTLAPAASADVEAARLAFNAAETNGGSWKTIASIQLFGYARCARSASLETIVNALPSDIVQTIQGMPLAESVDRRGLVTDRFLSGTSGSALLGALDSWAGPRGLNATTAVRSTVEVPCHNCTDHESVLVVSNPKTRKVVVLSGRFGWDS